MNKSWVNHNLNRLLPFKKKKSYKKSLFGSKSKIRKYIPAGWNKCLPHAQKSGTHNVLHYLDHLEFCGRKYAVAIMNVPPIKSTLSSSQDCSFYQTFAYW